MEIQVINVESLSEVYSDLNNRLLSESFIQASRYGNTKEMQQVLLGINSPLKRCVGGNHRNMNVFFLLAEAMWIWAGRWDVKFLSLFNERIKEFSDDGEVFHAPYGYRLRRWGVPTKPDDPSDVGWDQIYYALRMFVLNKETRRVALSIWNPKLDLAVETKDIPCNDFIMLKIRNEKELFVSVVNRSNDYHWGLPTNVFQFSFIFEVFALLLGVTYKRQAHFIDSLHIYTDNPLGSIIKNSNSRVSDMYDYTKPVPIDYKFNHPFEMIPLNLQEFDYTINLILDSLMKYQDQTFIQAEDFLDKEHEIKQKSGYLFFVYNLLKIYIDYKRKKPCDDARMKAVSLILELCEESDNRFSVNTDIVALSLNFFVCRMKEKGNVGFLPEIIGTL